MPDSSFAERSAAVGIGDPAVPAVSMRGITRRFGPVLANDDVSLDLLAGEIHALVGENGAGKTTLMRVLYGLIRPDSGMIERAGRRIVIRSPADAIRLGLGMVHQHFMLVEPLTVAENVTLGREAAGSFGALGRQRAERAVSELAARHGIPVDAGARVETLSVGAQQRVEILKALYLGARVLILDEPTAVLTPQEVDDLFRVLQELRAQGTTIVLITHKLGEVKAIAQRVTVMRAGRVVGGGLVASLGIEEIAERMVGHPIAPLHGRTDRAPVTPRLEVRGLEVADDRGLEAVKGVSFTVRGGEIVGIAGVDGNGQRELLDALAGLRPPRAGMIAIDGHACSGRSAREHAEAGMAHIPSDRLRDGVIAEMTAAENLALGRHREPDLDRGPLLRRAALARWAAPLLERFDVRPAQPDARAGRLSGGNQQKLVVARALSRAASVILAAHPTRGVDLGALAFIHQRLLEARDAGRAVLLVSSELTEILALSDRILVMFEGRLAHETRPAETDERALGLAMTGRSDERSLRSHPPTPAT